MSERRKRAVRVSGDSEEFSEGSEDVEVIKASEGVSTLFLMVFNQNICAWSSHSFFSGADYGR